MSFPADSFRSGLRRAHARILLIVAFAGISSAVSAAGQVGTAPVPEVKAGAANAASAATVPATPSKPQAGVIATTTTTTTPEKPPPAQAPPAVPSPACDNKSTAAEAYDALGKISPTIQQIRVASRTRFLPLNNAADILAFVAPDPTRRFRIILVADDEHRTQWPWVINSDQVWGEAATAGVAGTDFKQAEDKTLKTMIHFTPAFDSPRVYWKHTRVYVIGCAAGGVPQQFGQFDTNMTDQWLCRALAVFLAAVFYFLAAHATFYIHRSQRVYTDKQDIAKFGVNGTNYASRLHHFNPVVLAAGGNGRGSATKLQILFFSLVVFGLVSYIWMSTGYLSDLSSTVLLLMGISGFGAAAATATDVAKTRLDFDNWAWLINRSWLPKGGVAEVNRAEWKDIVTTDGEFDVYRFQMITFSVLVGMALLGAGGKMGELSTFTIPEALLGILGLSQVVYVAGKLVAPPAISQLNDQIVLLRKAESNLQAALTKQEVSAASTGAAALPLYRDELATRVGDSFDKYMEAWETTRTMFESTLSREVSAVAEGYRPPFPYLSPPADVLAVLESRFIETNKKLTDLETALKGQLAANPAVQSKIDAITAARAAYELDLTSARDALAKFIQQVKDAEAQPAAKTADEANQRAKDKAKNEAIVRNVLDLLRRRIDRLNQMVA